MPPLRLFFEELKRRRVFSILAVYIAGGFAILEATDDLSGRFGWPATVFEIVLILMLTGVVNAVVAAWFHGAVEEQRWRRQEWLLHLVPVLLAGVILAATLGTDRKNEITLDKDSLTFTGFETETGKEADRNLGDLLARDLTNTLASATGFRIKPRDQGSSASLLIGRIVTRGGRVRIYAELIDVRNGLQLWSETFENDFPLPEGGRHETVARISSSVAEALRTHFRND